MEATASSSPALFVLREVVAADAPFMAHSFLNSYRRARRNKRTPSSVYFRHHRALWDRLMARGDSRALIACAPEDASHVSGWVVYADLEGVPVVHYVYTKHNYRELGIAAGLLAAAGAVRGSEAVFTCATQPWKALAARVLGRAHFVALEEWIGQ